MVHLALSSALHLVLVATVAWTWLLAPIVTLGGPVCIASAGLWGTLQPTHSQQLIAMFVVSALGLGALLPAAAQVLRPGRPTFRWLALPLCVLPAAWLAWAFVPGALVPVLAPLVFPSGRVFPVGL